MKKERKMLSKFLFTDRMGCYKGISYGFWNSYWYLPIYRQCVFVLKWTLFCILLYPVYKPPHKTSQLTLISCCGNFVETHKSCRISGESSDNFGSRELGQASVNGNIRTRENIFFFCFFIFYDCVGIVWCSFFGKETIT